MRADTILGRRRFLGIGGAIAGGVVLGGSSILAGCGSDSGSGDSDAGTSGSDPYVLVKRWDDTANSVGRVRLPLSLASPTDMALLTGASGPERVTGRVVDDGGAQVATFDTPRHADAIANPYWPIRLALSTAGIYTMFVDGADENGLAFQVFDAKDVATPTMDGPLPPFDTPTTASQGGVNPICTRTPNVRPFHERTLADALASGKHVVYMVGTPAHCQFGTCAPGLEFLITAAAAFEDSAVFVHAEVYTDDTATDVAPAVSALGLGYEPVIYITDRSGNVTDRIDVVWDQPELDEVLAANVS